MPDAVKSGPGGDGSGTLLWAADTLAWAGGILIVLGTIIAIAGFFVAAIPRRARNIAAAAAVTGIGVVLASSVLRWIGTHWVLVVVVAVLGSTAAALIWLYVSETLEKALGIDINRDGDLDGDPLVPQNRSERGA